MTDPVLVQRLEGAALAVAATLAFFYLGFPWWAFLVLLVAVDLFALGYLAGPRPGAVVYNLGHSLILPAAAVVTYCLTGAPQLLALASVWLAHIGIDRALGFGLKHPQAFGLTHLGSIGKQRRD
jgi:hypothetical protein